jgi:hypothetical protein
MLLQVLRAAISQALRGHRRPTRIPRTRIADPCKPSIGTSAETRLGLPHALQVSGPVARLAGNHQPKSLGGRSRAGAGGLVGIHVRCRNHPKDSPTPAHSPRLNIIAKSQGHGDEKRAVRQSSCPKARISEARLEKLPHEKCDFAMLSPASLAGAQRSQSPVTAKLYPAIMQTYRFGFRYRCSILLSLQITHC